MKRMEDRADVESAQSEGERPGFSSMSPDRRTNKRRKKLRKRRERERVNNKVAAKVVRLRWEYC